MKKNHLCSFYLIFFLKLLMKKWEKYMICSNLRLWKRRCELEKKLRNFECFKKKGSGVLQVAAANCVLW